MYCCDNKSERITDWLEKRAAEMPERSAVTDGNKSFTWGEFCHGAQKAGAALLPYVQGNQPVAVCASKSVDTLVCMMGAVYAGGFYVVIDPSLPDERVRTMLGVLKPCAIVASEQEKERLEKLSHHMSKETPVLSMDSLLVREGCEEEAKGALQERRRNSLTDDILYAVFTSGSTGTPKCVVVTHRCVIDFISHFTGLFHINENDIIANQAPFDFDVSVKDIYSSLYTGASLVLVPKMLFGFPGKLIDFLCEYKATVLTWAVSALSLVAAMGGLKYRVPDTVRRVMFSGEVMPGKILKQWRQALPDAVFVNLYGPSEITCNCTYYILPEDFDPMDKMPVGQAFPGRQITLADEEGKPVSGAQQEGEICVTGESVAVGYYHNETETGKRFFETDDGVRGYRTGDLGYFGTDGLLYFSGRKDFQIKHMGHRIELEEVGRCMEKQDGVDRGLCLFDENRNRLVGFYTGDVEPPQLRSGMKESIPAYMIPHKLYRLEQWPVNKNGKTDRQSLMQKISAQKGNGHAGKVDP